VILEIGLLQNVIAKRRLADYVSLTKPGVVAMVLITTFVGYHLGADGALDPLRVLDTLIATALAAGGTLALNQYLERDLDGLMARTRLRPLPDGRLRPVEALTFGGGLLLLGLAWLALRVGWLPALVTTATAVTYLLVYTPLKPVTSLCSLAGAIPGALPPVAGWAAARGTLGLEPWVLFGIMFLWQIPHSLAIGRMYRDDYARAGIRVLPVVDPDGGSTERQIVTGCLALHAAGLLPTLIGLTGAVYFFGALFLGAVFLVFGAAQALRPSEPAARRVVIASVVYLPLLLVLMALDKVG